jgi:hypothetical protein
MISRLLQGAGNYKPKPVGPPLLFGNEELGYYGRVPSTEFITYYQLAAALSLPSMGDYNLPAVEWLRFAYKGKVLYIPRANHIRTISWQAVANQGFLAGRTLTVQGKQYKTRMVNGGVDANADSEWRSLMCRVVAGSVTGQPDWDNYELKDINFSSLGSFNTTGTLSSELVGGKAVIRGLNQMNQFQPLERNDGDRYVGWRPVLELIP